MMMEKKSGLGGTAVDLIDGSSQLLTRGLSNCDGISCCCPSIDRLMLLNNCLTSWLPWLPTILPEAIQPIELSS